MSRAGAHERTPTRILVVRVGAMGDVLHALPAVAALRSALPDAVLGWAIEPRWEALLRVSGRSHAALGTTEMPLVDTVHLVHTRRWSKNPLSRETWRSVLSLRNELHRERYHLAIDLQGSIRSSVIARMSGADQVCGSATPREPPARLLYHHQVSLRSAHVIEQAIEIAGAAIDRNLKAAPFPLPVDPEAEMWCRRLLLADPRPPVLLAPSAGWGAKVWPAERYGAVAHELHKRRFRVLVNAAEPADALAGSVLAYSQGSAEIVACSLAQLTSLLRRCALTLAGDTGPLHLAAALGRPVIALFGPTDPHRTGPYGTPSRVIRHPHSATDHRRHTTSEAGLAQVTVEEVLDAALNLLDSFPTEVGNNQA